LCGSSRAGVEAAESRTSFSSDRGHLLLDRSMLHFRFRLRSLMIAVAVVALLLGAVLEGLHLKHRSVFYQRMASFERDNEELYMRRARNDLHLALQIEQWERRPRTDAEKEALAAQKRLEATDEYKELKAETALAQAEYDKKHGRTPFRKVTVAHIYHDAAIYRHAAELHYNRRRTYEYASSHPWINVPFSPKPPRFGHIRDPLGGLDEFHKWLEPVSQEEQEAELFPYCRH
jgi:hypothetical protein